MLIFIITKSFNDSILLEILNVKKKFIKNVTKQFLCNSLEISNSVNFAFKDSISKKLRKQNTVYCHILNDKWSNKYYFNINNENKLLEENITLTKGFIERKFNIYYTRDERIADSRSGNIHVTYGVPLTPVYASVILGELGHSSIYRKNFRKISKGILKSKAPLSKNKGVVMILIDNYLFPIDYKIGGLCNLSLQEQQHLEYAMSWLSTLGGAFSALGDYDSKFVECAYETSRRQMRIALRLQNYDLIARCWLYYALSLIQKYRFKKAAEIIRYIFKWNSKRRTTSDQVKLSNMCFGIWSKLKYDRKCYLDARPCLPSS